MIPRSVEVGLDGFFYTNEHGETAFFPAGFYGRHGFLVESPEQMAALRAAILRAWMKLFGYYMLAAVPLALLQYGVVWYAGYAAMWSDVLMDYFLLWFILIRYLPMIALVVATLLWFRAQMRRLAQGMTPATFRNRATQMDHLVKSDLSALWLMAVLLGIVTAGVVYMAIVEDLLLMLLATPFTATLATFSFRGALEKMRRERSANALKADH